MLNHTFKSILILGLFAALMANDCFAQLITQSEARRVGLTRKWNAQVVMNSSQSTLKQILLDHGTLFSLTDTGQLQAFDAETGASLWMVQVGRRDLLVSEMDASKNYVAVMNGSLIYVYNRFNGKLLWTGEATIAPGAGPAVSESRVYIPGLNGRVQSFPLRLISDALKEFGKDEKTLSPEEREQLEIERRDSLRIDDQYVDPLNVQSIGRIYQQPVISRDDVKEGLDNIVWVTDNGTMYLGSIRTPVSANDFEIKYHVPTEKDISSRPTFIEYDRTMPDQTGVIYMGSRDGFVYSIREIDGKQLWTFPCNEPIVENLAVVSRMYLNEKKKEVYDRRVYIPTYQRGMFCLDAIKGDTVLWQTPGIKRFLAQSNSRVYTVDSRNNLTVLSLESGQILGSIPLKDNKIQYLNEITDRIYVATDTGMIQCLAQIDQDKPIYFRQDPAPKKEREIDLGGDEEPAKAKKPEKSDADEEQPGVGDDDFGNDDNNDDGFGGGDDAFGDGDNAFGDDANDGGAKDDDFGSDADFGDDKPADDGGAADGGDAADDGALDDPF